MILSWEGALHIPLAEAILCHGGSLELVRIFEDLRSKRGLKRFWVEIDYAQKVKYFIRRFCCGSVEAILHAL